MSRRLAIFLVCALVLPLVPSSAWAARAPLGQETAAIAGTLALSAAEVPAVLAENNVPTAAWQRIAEQIRADQAQTGCTECAAALDLAEQTKLTAADGQDEDRMGVSVAIWGDTIVVGACFSDPGGTTDQGSAYVFQRNYDPANPTIPLADNWGLVKKLTASDGAMGDDLGSSVAIWGDTIVVGAPEADVASNGDQGAAYVFVRNQGGADKWGEVKKLTASDGATNDAFGTAVDVWVDWVLVGSAEARVGSNSQQGAAYLFARNYDPANPGTPLADNWGQRKKLTAADGTAGDGFGGAVAIHADIALVGAQADQNSRGSAYLFERNYDPAAPATPSSDNWGQRTKLTAPDGADEDFFGLSVDIWGDTAVVGAPLDDIGSRSEQGSAYLYGRNYDPSAPGTPLANNWGLIKKLTASDGGSSDTFGFSLSIWGDTLLVGGIWDADARGSVWVFTRNRIAADSWGQEKKVTASDGTGGDEFGRSVALWGDTAVIGARGDDIGSNADQGSAYVFACPCTPGSEFKKEIASDGAADDKFSVAVAIYGDTLVVGAFWDHVGTIADQGSAYVFERNYDPANPGTPLADNWGEVKKLTASDGATDDRFGYSVAIWGDIVVVGCPLDNTGAVSDHGSAYLFARNQGGANNWGQVKKLTASDGAATDRFGYSVAICEDLVVVGAYWDDVAGQTDQGSAYLFARNQGGADNWGQVKQLTASDGVTDDKFGVSVAIYGDTIVVGAFWDHVGANADQGSAYVFARNQGGVNNWGQVKRITASDGAASDNFGYSMALCGDTVVVGSPLDNTGTVGDHGSAYLFARNQGGADNWGQVKKLIASDGVASDWLGYSVAIWGDTVVVGAYTADVGANIDQGSAYLYERNQGGADNWGQVSKLTSSDGAQDDRFGQSAGIWGDWVVVGAYYHDVGANANQGAAYLFGCTPDLALSKSAAPARVVPQGVLTYTLSYSNTLPYPAAEVYLSDTLPADAVFGGVVSAPAGWAGPTFAGQVVGWYRPTLGAGVSGQLVFTATAGTPLEMRADWTLTNTAEITTTSDLAPANNRATATSVLQVPDLVMAKAAEPELVFPQGVLTYTLDLTNTLPGLAAEVYVTDTLPAGTTFGGVVSAPAGWTGPSVVGQAVGWYTPTLGGGVSGQIVFTAIANLGVAIHPDWVLTDTAEIACTFDMTPTNNSATAASVLQGLSIAKTHYPEPVTAAWNFWYYIDVTNTASTAATNLVIEDVLPVEVPPYSVVPSAGGVFDGINKVTWTIPSLGPNSSMQVWIRARTFSTAAGKCMVNSAVADSEQAAPAVGMKEIACVVAPPAEPQPTPTPTPGPGGPVIIQEGTFGHAEDTHVYRYAPGKNYFLAPQLKVGYKQNYAALLRFDLSPIPAGATIDSAMLQVYAEGWGGSDLPIGAYAVLRNVLLNQTTWNVAQTAANWETGGGNGATDRRPYPESSILTYGPKQWYSFDITSLVQEWVNATLPNNGLLLRAENSYPADFYFTSAEGGTVEWRPKLVVRYH